MALDFPTSPTVGQIYNGYIWTGTVWDSTANQAVTLSTVAAGDNYIINGGFDIWQRGTSFALTGVSSYTADRWVHGSSVVVNQTVSRVAAATTNLQYGLQFGRNSGQTTTATHRLLYALESSQSKPLVGQTVTLSFKALRGANAPTALSVVMVTGTGTDQSAGVIWSGWTGQSTAGSTTVSLGTSVATYQLTATISSSANQVGFYFEYSSTGTAGAAEWVQIEGVQLEAGSVATAFRRNAPSLQAELAACQRYYIRFTGHGTGSAGYPLLGAGACISANQVDLYIILPSQLRTTSYTVETLNAGVYDMSAVQSGGTWSIPYTPPTPTNYVIIRYTHTASSFTVARYSVATSATSGASYIALNAEL